MKKKHIILFSIFLITNVIISQNLTVNYKSKSTIDTLSMSIVPEIVRDLVKGEPYVLNIQDGKSLYSPLGKKQINSEKEKSSRTDQNGNINKNLSRNQGYSETIYKNMDSNLMNSQINIFGGTFLIKENNTNTPWEITDIKEKIGNYNCQMAAATINGYYTEAWFTTEVPISQGPSIYSGLPGLILKVKFGKKLIIATDIKQNTKRQEIYSPKEGKEITRQDYNNIVAKQRNKTSSKTVNGNTTTTTTVTRH